MKTTKKKSRRSYVPARAFERRYVRAPATPWSVILTYWVQGPSVRAAAPPAGLAYDEMIHKIAKHPPSRAITFAGHGGEGSATPNKNLRELTWLFPTYELAADMACRLVDVPGLKSLILSADVILAAALAREEALEKERAALKKSIGKARAQRIAARRRRKAKK